MEQPSKLEHSRQDYLKFEVNFNRQLCNFIGDENGILHLHTDKLGIQLKLMNVGDDIHKIAKFERQFIIYVWNDWD